MREIDKKILEFLQTIPRNKVISYKVLWEKFWVHPRKIAAVMRYNKDPITYPCYKVLADNGKISWYNTDRWVEEKIEKLQKDGIMIQDNIVEKKYFLN
jgi:alkylated DNA nucleotide flippase Atl1